MRYVFDGILTMLCCDATVLCRFGGRVHLATLVALRFLRRGNSFWPSFTAVTSVLGVALGVSAFLVVTTVFRSFEKQLSETLMAANPHLTIYNFPAGIPDAASFQTRMLQKLGRETLASGLFEYSEGIMSKDLHTAAVVIRGIEGENSASAPEVAPLVQPAGAFAEINNPSFSRSASGGMAAIVAKGLALKLGARIGDAIQLTTAGRRGEQIAVKLRVAGIFSLGLAGYDERLLFINFQDAVSLWGKAGSARGVEFRLRNPESALQIAQGLRQSTQFVVQPWQTLHQEIFEQIERDGRAVELVVGIISLVGAFNILTTLTLNVFDRARQIAVIRSVGGSRKLILRVFVTMGLVLGFVGATLGVGLGYAVLRVFENVNLGDLKSVYYLEKIPVTYNVWLMAFAVVLTLALSLLSSLYPAWKAVRTSPLHGFKPEYQ